MSTRRFVYSGRAVTRLLTAGPRCVAVLGRTVITVLTAALVGVMAAAPASGHDSLVSADPADGATLAAGPSQIRLTFDAPVQSGFTTVTVTGPGGTRWEGGEPAVSGNAVTAAVNPLGPVGEYVIGYRAVSSDGHPVSGTLTFRLTTAGPGTPSIPGPAANGDGTGDGTPLWPWVVTVVTVGLLLGVGATAALRLSRAKVR